MNFSCRLRDLIAERGISQRDVARAVEIAESALTNYLRGRVPKSEELYKLSLFFGVRMEWLLAGVLPKQEEDPATAKMRATLEEQGTEYRVVPKGFDVSVTTRAEKAIDELRRIRDEISVVIKEFDSKE